MHACKKKEGGGRLGESKHAFWFDCTAHLIFAIDVSVGEGVEERVGNLACCTRHANFQRLSLKITCGGRKERGGRRKR